MNARLEILQARREELHEELHTWTRRAFTSEDYYALINLTKRCAANAAEIEMLRDSL